MEKQNSTNELNLGGPCVGQSHVYKHEGTTTADAKCCNSRNTGFEHFLHKTTTAPRFLRDVHNNCRISYPEFSRRVDDFRAGKPVPINIFDAIKYIYGISMVDIAVVLGVTYGVVYRAKTKGFAKKRITQFANGLCVPEKFLFNISTNDFEELSKCKKEFFRKPSMTELLESMPDWKMQLARDISFIYVHCPIHIAKTIARVDNLYWNDAFPMDEYTESEQVFINYITKETPKYKPIHNLEYFLDNACKPHMEIRAIQKEDLS